MAVGEKAWLRRPAVRAGMVSVLAMGYAVLVWFAAEWWGTWILGVGLVAMLHDHFAKSSDLRKQISRALASIDTGDSK